MKSLYASRPIHVFIEDGTECSILKFFYWWTPNTKHTYMYSWCDTCIPDWMCTWTSNLPLAFCCRFLLNLYIYILHSLYFYVSEGNPFHLHFVILMTNRMTIFNSLVDDRKFWNGSFTERIKFWIWNLDAFKVKFQDRYRIRALFIPSICSLIIYSILIIQNRKHFQLTDYEIKSTQFMHIKFN